MRKSVDARGLLARQNLSIISIISMVMKFAELFPRSSQAPSARRESPLLHQCLNNLVTRTTEMTSDVREDR